MYVGKRMAKMAVIVMAVIVVFAFSTVAFAATGSPSASVGSVEAVDSTGAAVTPTIGAAASEDASGLDKAAEKQYGQNAETLATFDLTVAVPAGGSVTITMDVAGVKADDTIKVIHEYAEGQYEYLDAKVLAAGRIQFTLKSASPMSVIRIAKAASATNNTTAATVTTTSATTMYKTNDTTPVVSMVLLAAICGIVMFACGKALKKAE